LLDERCITVERPHLGRADPIETRPGFAELLNRIEDNGVRTVIVEDASRFARELVTQELGILALIKRGICAGPQACYRGEGRRPQSSTAAIALYALTVSSIELRSNSRSPSADMDSLSSSVVGPFKNVIAPPYRP
jgi:hypothetical protein